MRLFSNRSQMTSKCGKNKKSGTRGDSRVCHWCSYHILTSSVIYLLNRCTATWNLFVLYSKKTELQLFISKSLTITRKPAFAHFGLGFTWRHKLCWNQCPPCWCPSGVKCMLIIVYFYCDASLWSLIISPTTGISRNKKVDKKTGIHLKVSQCSLGLLKA